MVEEAIVQLPELALLVRALHRERRAHRVRMDAQRELPRDDPYAIAVGLLDLGHRIALQRPAERALVVDELDERDLRVRRPAGRPARNRDVHPLAWRDALSARCAPAARGEAGPEPEPSPGWGGGLLGAPAAAAAPRGVDPAGGTP